MRPLYAKALDAHESLGLMADPTQALMLRDYNIARGNLSAYNVHGVTALQPHPLDTHLHTHARMCRI